MFRTGPLSLSVTVATAALLSVLPAGAATLRGQVLAAATGMPLPRAAVTLRRPEFPNGNRTATADAQGRYEFKDLPAGRYYLSASKAGYLNATYGQARPGATEQSVDVRTDSEVREQIDFRLVRAGAISGSVTDDFGEPLADVRISANRYEFIAGLRRLAAIGRVVQTNDLGEFRLYGLPPGRYYLGAATTYAPTYYPGTVNAAEAQPITIEAGQDVSNIGLSILPIQNARISGTAIDASGRPMYRATVMAIQSLGVTGGVGGPVGTDGSFTLNNLAPGDYTIKVSPNSGDSQEVATAKVSINGEDVTGLVLIAQKPAQLRGRIVLEASGPVERSTIRLDALRVQALRLSPEESLMIGIANGGVDAEGAFAVSVPPGPTLLRFTILPTGWRLKAVRLNGLDVTDTGLHPQSDQTLDGAELVVSNVLSGVSGTVTDSENRFVADYSVVIFPEDRGQWHFQSRFLARAQPDKTGAFKANLPPGKYLAIAVDALGPGEELDPDFLDRALPRAVRFSLLEGEMKAVDLRLQSFR
jgi:hypothetical protein